MCARLKTQVAEPVGGFSDASIDGLLAAAEESPAGFRLLFQHALRDPSPAAHGRLRENGSGLQASSSASSP